MKTCLCSPAHMPLHGWRIFLLAALLAAGHRSGARAEDRRELPRFTLEQCLEIGLREATARATARLDEEIAKARVGQVRAEAWPNLSVSGTYTRLDEVTRLDFFPEAVEFGRLNNYTAAAELTQLLYAGGRVRSALAAARSYRALSRAETRQVEQTLRLRIRTDFQGLLLARRKVEVREASLAQVRAMAEEAERRNRAGTGSDFDRLAAQVRLANEHPLLLAARRAYRLALTSFRDAVRLPVEDFEPEGELTWTSIDVDPEHLRETARKHRPEIEIMEMRLQLLRAELRAERGQYLPSVQARAAYTGNNPDSFGSSEEGWDWGWEVGLVAHWSLFDGALTQNRIREKRRELEKAILAREDLLRAIDLEVEQALLDLRYAEETVKASRETVALAEQGLSIARTRYETGSATRLEYTDAQLALNTARLGRARALRDHGAALAHLAYAAGVRIESLIVAGG